MYRIYIPKITCLVEKRPLNTKQQDQWSGGAHAAGTMKPGA